MRTTRKSLWAMTVALLAVALTMPSLVIAGRDTSQADQRRALQEYAADTWQSFVEMTNPTTGLPSDNIQADTRARSEFTSPTNIGTYLWSTLAARDLGLISQREALARLAQTLDTLGRLERHEQSGMFFNWYHPETGAKLTRWPPSITPENPEGDPVYPFLSSVDNGWLAAALIMVQNAVPQLRAQAAAIEEAMEFNAYYDPNARGPGFPAGLLRGGFWDEPPPGCSVPGTWEGDDVYYPCHHYGSLNTEPRIASYIGISEGQLPAQHYFAMWRTFPETCDWGWQEMDPDGVTRTYMGVEVYEGHYRYRGMRLVPTWGGSMFEALMVTLLVPEEQWGARSWGVNHPLYVRAQIEHGLEEADYGYWGFSPSNNPDGGYREYGVDPIGLEPNGYASDQENNPAVYCRPPQPEPAAYGRGVVTPHASFLTLPFAPDEALTNLANLRSDFDAYGWGGFYDAIDVRTGKVSRYYLALDQGMIMAAIANELRGDRMRHYFVRGDVQSAIQPLLAIEEFTAGE
jgi:hypothetical protein